MDDSPRSEFELLIEIARLYAEIARLHTALLRLVRAIDDPPLKAEIADLIWPPTPGGIRD